MDIRSCLESTGVHSELIRWWCLGLWGSNMSTAFGRVPMVSRRTESPMVFRRFRKLPEGIGVWCVQSDDALPHPEGTVEEVESLAGPDSCQVWRQRIMLGVGWLIGTMW